MAKYVEHEIEVDIDSLPKPTIEYSAWEIHKENIQPIPQGRKIDALMEALTIIDDNSARREEVEAKKKQFLKELEGTGDESAKLDVWTAHIDWLEQHVPDGGKVNGITDAIEQCIEMFYDKKDFKQDERLFEMFMKFKRFCDEPLEVFSFMYANSLCTLLARFYLNWSWQYEIRKNVKRAGDLLKLGLKNLASPRDVLEEAQSQLGFRVNRMIQNGELDECPEMGALNTRETQATLESGGIRAALQTLKCHVSNRKGLKVPVNRVGSAVDHKNVGGLKSQTRVVNGVRVPKQASKTKLAQRPVAVFSDENGPPPSGDSTELDENGQPMVRKGLLKDKIPTSQRIHQVGRSGVENQIPKRGILTTSSRPPLSGA